MLKIVVDYPKRDEERTILQRALDDTSEGARPVVDIPEIGRLRDAVRAVEVNDRLREYIVRIVESTPRRASTSTATMCGSSTGT